MVTISTHEAMDILREVMGDLDRAGHGGAPVLAWAINTLTSSPVVLRNDLIDISAVCTDCGTKMSFAGIEGLCCACASLYDD
jgi:hypothetical protein